ncbi:ferritin-like domain-containing protein [Nocardiopsis sp. EMB25]|uniref:ferritin-like domain-containing protein n=1 Tax=Nocardiopsis TaxID=2013 RepID=UPI00034C3731|nr:MULTISPECIES: ferritin-like domain-containing protein [Nocardiopsis]MCY9785389.1 ferritin-like domain-containing protein [Nocardiopsis sp. EMB25]
MGRSDVSRRTALGVALAVGLAGCGRTEWYPSDVTPEEHVLRAMIREKERTVTRYQTALANGTGPEELLNRILEHHLSHVDALMDALPESSATEGEETPEAELPAPDAALDTAGLRALEAAAASARVDRALAVADPGLAQLISGIGACEAGHAHLLDQAD